MIVAALIAQATAVAGPVAVDIPVTVATPADAPAVQQLPEAVARMIDAAVATKDPAKIKTVAEIAKATNPQATAAIEARLPPPPPSHAPFEILKTWTGKLEAGGAVSTGNSDRVGVLASMSLKHSGARWTHAIDALVDYQSATGSQRVERYRGAYSSRLKLRDDLYAYGLLEAERDRPAGFDSRFSQALGIGYRVVQSPSVQLEVEGGPALREVDYVDGDNDVTVSGRASLIGSWKLSDNATMTQRTATYLDSDNRTVQSTTALTTRIFGPLSVRLAFDLRNEKNPADDRKRTDTTSRATVVYSF